MLKSLRKYIAAAFIMLTAVFTASAQASAVTVAYTQLDVPSINSSFKSYMDYGCITAVNSPQYHYLDKWCWVDYDGFVRCNAEAELGITSDYYAVAMGSYYGTEIGTKYKVTTDTDKVFYCVLVDCKDNSDTNYTNQYGTDNNDIFEFIVNTYRYEIKENGRGNKQYLYNSENVLLNTTVSQFGSANVYMPLNGSIVSIERISFI